MVAVSCLTKLKGVIYCNYMLLRSLARVTNFGLQGFWRNLWLSAVTVTIITLSLLSVSLLATISVLSSAALERLEERIDVSVYLKPELKADDIELARRQIESIPGVKSVMLISSADALERFRAKHASNPLISESILELGQNPLGATVVVKAATEAGYQSILSELETSRHTIYIQEARFDDYRKVVNTVSDISGRLRQIGGVVTAVFVAITLLVVFNAIRINIYTHREEIAIMRLVGATSWFIRGPFWVESVLYAGLATLVAAALFFPLLSLFQPYISTMFNGYEFDMVRYFSVRSLPFFGLQFVAASLLNVVASTVAMRRYLRV